MNKGWGFLFGAGLAVLMLWLLASVEAQQSTVGGGGTGTTAQFGAAWQSNSAAANSMMTTNSVTLTASTNHVTGDFGVAGAFGVGTLVVGNDLNVTGVVRGNGNALTNVHGTNLVWYPTTMPSATNTLALNNGYSILVTATDISITNISGVTAGQAMWTTLQVSNSAASAITARMLVGATVRAQGAATTNGLVIGAAKVGFLSFHAMGSSNYWTTAQQ